MIGSLAAVLGIGPYPEETPGLEHLLSHAVRRADRKSPAETGVMSEQPENPPEPRHQCTGTCALRARPTSTTLSGRPTTRTDVV